MGVANEKMQGEYSDENGAKNWCGVKMDER
jgi:hypothetical protein